MSWKNMFASMNDKNIRMEDQETQIDMPQTEDRLTEQTQEIHKSNVDIENVISQMADAIQKELYGCLESKMKEMLSSIDKKFNLLYQAIELLGNSQQQILKNQVDTAKEVLAEKEKIAVIAEKQEETIQKQHNSLLKFQEDVIYKISSGKANKTTAEKFVNPLFYKTLLPISKAIWETQLTPTLQISHSDDRTDVATCKLLQNTMNYIVLQCTYFNILQKSYVTDCYQYKMWKCNPEKEYCYGLTWKVAEKGLNCKTLTEDGYMAFFMVDEEE